MDRFRRSWELMKESWRVLRDNPSLSVFPVVSSIATLLVTISFALPIYFSMQGKAMDKMPPAGYAVLFVYYLASYFVTVFFNAGLIHCANEALQERATSFGSGINAAAKHIGPILGWSLLGATVGTILRTISERTGIIGQIVVAMFGAAWNIVTFFTVPMLVLEGVGPVAALKGSVATIKKAWGEALIGNAGVSLSLSLLALGPIPLIGVGIWASVSMNNPIAAIFAIGLSILYWIALATIGAALHGIYTTATFVYARTGEVPGGFNPQVIQSAFIPNPRDAFGRKRPL